MAASWGAWLRARSKWRRCRALRPRESLPKNRAAPAQHVGRTDARLLRIRLNFGTRLTKKVNALGQGEPVGGENEEQVLQVGTLRTDGAEPRHGGFGRG